MIRDSLCNIINATLQKYKGIPKTEDARAELEARLRIEIDSVNGVADSGAKVKIVYDERNLPVFSGTVSYRADAGESGSQIIHFYLSESSHYVYR